MLRTASSSFEQMIWVNGGIKRSVKEAFQFVIWHLSARNMNGRKERAPSLICKPWKLRIKLESSWIRFWELLHGNDFNGNKRAFNERSSKLVSRRYSISKSATLISGIGIQTKSLSFSTQELFEWKKLQLFIFQNSNFFEPTIIKNKSIHVDLRKSSNQLRWEHNYFLFNR